MATRGTTILKRLRAVPWTHKSYQYLQQSQVPTYVFQKSLPDLPIPSLSETCQRYLTSLQPLLQFKEFMEVEKVVHSFLENDGPSLHQSLVEEAKKSRNTASYISKEWFDMYLKSREPLVPKSNSGILLSHDTRPEMHLDSIQRPVNILISSLRFYRSLKEQILLPEVYHSKPSKSDVPEFWERVRNAPDSEATQLSWLWGAFPLDMSQFEHLFGSTRLPREKKDIIKNYPDSKHIVVIRGGHFYMFDALTSNGELFPPSYYQDAFMKIMSDQPPVNSQHDIGVLTSEDRSTWAKLRGHLSSLSQENEFGLRQIDSALLCMCMDEHWQHDFTNDLPGLCNATMGSNPANRWFDKSYALIFSANGALGFNHEHSWGDGMTLRRYFSDIMTDSQKHHFLEEVVDQQFDLSPEVTRIEFQLDDFVGKHVGDAITAYHRRVNAVEFHSFNAHGFGNSQCIQAGISPDALMQSCFILAYFKMHGHLTSVYESCSTGIYKHGRTETIRSCTVEMGKMAHAFTSSTATEAEKLDALRECSRAHKVLITRASQGLGWDRHLFALYLRAIQNGSVPELFQHPSYALATANGISSSTGKFDIVLFGGFAPVNKDGYGITYRIHSEALDGVVSSYRKEEGSSARGQAMADAVESTFQDFKTVLRRA